MLRVKNTREGPGSKPGRASARVRRCVKARVRSQAKTTIRSQKGPWSEVKSQNQHRAEPEPEQSRASTRARAGKSKTWSQKQNNYPEKQKGKNIDGENLQGYPPLIKISSKTKQYQENGKSWRDTVFNNTMRDF